MPASLPGQLRSAAQRRRTCLCRWGWLGLGLGLAFSSARGAAPTEYHVKAAFLYNFTKFVEWPPDRFADANASIVIAVLGRNPFGSELEDVVRGRRVDGRPIQVRLLSSEEEVKAARGTFHILFVAAGEERAFAAWSASLPRHGVLTVGESNAFAVLGGIVNFVLVENKVRFEINRPVAEAAGLKLRAQLQKLAVPARGSPP